MRASFKADPQSGIPIYHQISKHLRDQIVSGKIPPGTLLPSGQELSKTYGVAYRTLVKSLSSLKKEGLLVGIPSQGTFTRKKEQSLRNIAIVFDQKCLLMEDFASHLDVFQRAGATRCAENGFHLQLFSLPDYRIFNDETPTLLSQLLADRYIDGIITYSGPPPEDIRRLKRLSIPTVISRDMYPGSEIPWVIDDAIEGARQLIKFVVGGLGHRSVKLVLSYPLDKTADLIRPSSLFGEGLLSELASFGISAGRDDVAYTAYNWEKTVPVLKRWLQAEHRPSLLIFCDDTMARKGIALAESLGLSVPGDLSVACYGDILPQSTLTTIHIPIREIALKCVELLEQVIEGQPAASVEMPTELIIRETCGPAKRR